MARILPALAVAAVAVGACSWSVAAGGRASIKRLPLGDGKYRTSPKRGYVDSCQTSFNGGGAFRNGPWIDEGARVWDLTGKVSVQGAVRWPAASSRHASGSRLVVASNGLPNHPTGVFPIASSDPAYQYDRNPNSIKQHTISVALPRHPKVASRPTCVGGTIGIARNGIPIFSAFDAGGRDAPAHELQDSCSGHPEITGQYHYHWLPRCLIEGASTRRQSPLVGYALDGFGIYGPRGAHGKLLWSRDLDACHATTSTVTWQGKRKRIYHYVATYDFPYVVGCFRGTPVTSATGLMIGPPR